MKDLIFLLIAFLIIEIFGIDAAMIIAMWGFFACLGIALIGMLILEPMREEKRERDRLALKQK